MSGVDDKVRDSELLLDSLSSAPSWSCKHDGDVQERLERRWSLWREFMKEHAHLEAWLRLAEEAVSPPYSGHVSYADAKEELKKFERLRREAGARLVQLDGLTQRNRTLAQMFQGVMRARLLMATRESGRRWDDVNVRLEAVIGRIQHFVSEWEEFEAKREELALWLADMSSHLVEIDHETGSTCEKLRMLQSFQERVCVNSGRVNALLQRGEDLIQHSVPNDAQRVERRLLELLQHCSHVYNNIARTHTRLLSMRLVFEDDCILSCASDSGCPSEIPPDDDLHPDHQQQKTKNFSSTPENSSFSPLRHPSPVTHEHLGLEWDPSVDVGRSVSREDVDSSYFSACAGPSLNDGGLKRWSLLTSLDSRSNISNDEEIPGDSSPGAWLTALRREDSPQFSVRHWTTSTPDREEEEEDEEEPVGFDGRRVKAWLRVQSSTPLETGHSKAVQTEEPSHDPEGKAPDWLERLDPPNLQAAAEMSCCEEAEPLLSNQSDPPPSSSSSCPLLFLFLSSALLAVVLWFVLQPSCRRSNRTPPSFHMMLQYVNGPPPT